MGKKESEERYKPTFQRSTCMESRMDSLGSLRSVSQNVDFSSSPGFQHQRQNEYLVIEDHILSGVSGEMLMCEQEMNVFIFVFWIFSFFYQFILVFGVRITSAPIEYLLIMKTRVVIIILTHIETKQSEYHNQGRVTKGKQRYIQKTVRTKDREREEQNLHANLEIATETLEYVTYRKLFLLFKE
ncbi:hypothetical protein STEG23_037966 [Scotinomys teguina]